MIIKNESVGNQIHLPPTNMSSVKLISIETSMLEWPSVSSASLVGTYSQFRDTTIKVLSGW